MKEWKRRLIHEYRSTQNEKQINHYMRHKVSISPYPQLQHHTCPEAHEIKATMSTLNSASAVNNKSDLSRNTINSKNTMSINVTKCPLILRLTNLNPEHKNREKYVLQAFLLLFKCANHRNKRLFVSTANEALVGTLMTIVDVNDIFPIQTTQTKPFCWNTVVYPWS